MRKFYQCILALMLSVCVASPALAEEYPSKPITLLTVFNPGGGSDVSHRIIEKFAREYMSQPIIVTYKAGAGGEIGWTTLSQAKPTGYLIGGIDIPHILLQPLLRIEGQPGYKTEDLNPLCNLVYDPNIIMVRKDSKWKNFKEFLTYAKANPNKITVGTVGKLTGDHLFLMQIEHATGIKVIQVPYSGGGKASPALLSGEVDCYFGSVSNFLRMENTRGLAIATKERFELCPTVPTFIENGIDLESAKFRGLATPKNFPKEAQAYLEKVFSEMAANPKYQEAVKKVGLMPFYQNSQDFAKSIAEEKKIVENILLQVGILK